MQAAWVDVQKADGKGGGWHHGPHTLVRVLPTISSTVVRLDFCTDQCWFLESTSLVRLLTIDSSSPLCWRERWIIRVSSNSHDGCQWLLVILLTSRWYADRRS